MRATAPSAAPPGPAEPAPLASAAQRAIAVVGDEWTLRILRTVFRGKRRHGDFVEAFGVSRAVLADRLQRLTERGVLERVREDGSHPEYRLTERGLDLWSLFLAMWQWETDWGTARDPDTWAPDVPRPQPVHAVCGHAMTPQLRCTHCAQPVLPFDTAGEPGPGAAGVGTIADTASGFRRNRQTASPQARPQRLSRVIGDRWNCAIVAAAFRGVRQFAGFAHHVGIAPAQLSDRLAELQALGILRARPYAGSRLEYRLTPAGLALFPVTLELMRWGDRWLWPGGPPVVVRHLPCGQLLGAQWHCSHCEAVLARTTVRFSG